MTVSGKWQPFALGFRPFFLLGGLAAPVLILIWLATWHGELAAGDYYGRIGWHAHEMLFGYTVAIVAGFLLTAVRNWTGRPTPSGPPLALLAALWLAGRLLPWLPGIPPVVVAVVDLAFLPVLAFSLLPALRGVENRVNYILPVILLLMAVANGLMHLEALALAQTGRLGMQFMMDLVLVLLLLIAGRVMPFFIRVAVAGAEPLTRSWVEKGTLAFTLLLVLLHLVDATPLAAVAALVLGGLQAIRLAGWYHRGVWRIPILWVLVTGYAWLALSLLLRGIAELGWMPLSPAEHAFTVGAIGVTTLGMMARVTLGHTGRPMLPPKAMTIAFVLANFSALLRVAGPVLWPAGYVFWILLAGAGWIVAFAIFVYHYTLMLLRPRVDGRPG